MRTRLTPPLILALVVTAAGAADLSDPMRPPRLLKAPVTRTEPAKADAHDRELMLQSTLIAGDRRSAVINGQVVVPGARVEGARVLHIEADQVVLERGGKRLRLRAHNPVDKRGYGSGRS